jgi:hypothetical protein
MAAGVEWKNLEVCTGYLMLTRRRGFEECRIERGSIVRKKEGEVMSKYK